MKPPRRAPTHTRGVEDRASTTQVLGLVGVSGSCANECRKPGGSKTYTCPAKDAYAALNLGLGPLKFDNACGHWSEANWDSNSFRWTDELMTPSFEAWKAQPITATRGAETPRRASSGSPRL